MTLAETEVRNRDGAVDRGVEGDGQDHARGKAKGSTGVRRGRGSPVSVGTPGCANPRSLTPPAAAVVQRQRPREQQRQTADGDAHAARRGPRIAPSNRSSTVASGAGRAATTRWARLPVDGHRRATQALSAPDRPLHLAGCGDRDDARWPRLTVTRTGRSATSGIRSLPAHRGCGDALALAQHPLPAGRGRSRS